MKKIVLHFENGLTKEITEQFDDIDLIDSFNKSIEYLQISKINDFEWKIFESEENYQIFNTETKELYNLTEQSGVIKITTELDDDEFNHILDIINKKNVKNN